MSGIKHKFHSKPCMDELLNKRVKVDLGAGRWIEGLLKETDTFMNLTLYECSGTNPLGQLIDKEELVEFPMCIIRGAAVKAITSV